MRTLTNTQINKITNVVYNVLETKFKERNIDMSNLKMIDKEFNKICNELENELEDNVQDQFENEISFENVKLTIKNIEECVKQCLFDTDSNYQNFQELVKIGLDEEDEDEEEDEEDEEDEDEDEEEDEEETEVYFEQERMYKNSKNTSKMFKNKVSYLSKNLKICGVVLDIDSQLGVENQIETYIKSNHNVKNLKLVRVVDLRQKEIELKK